MIIHAVPTFINAHEYGAGNWKAVAANRLALESTGLPWRTVEFDSERPAAVVAAVASDTRHVLIEYSGYPGLLRQLRKRDPGVGLHVRTHNAEPYQYFHRATGRGPRDYVNPRLWLTCLGLGWRDARCRSAADTLLGISEWDNAHYWRWLPGGALVGYLPYFSPWPYLRPAVEPQAWGQRKPVMVSMGGNFDPSGMTNVANFGRIATRVSQLAATQWSFVLTWWSQWHDHVPKVRAPVELMRDCREPWDLLCQVRALAVLTPLGFGLKTTVVDGLAAGCHVIVHSELADRLPRPVRELCLFWDPSRDEDIAGVVAALSAPPLRHNLNQQLRERAVDTFRSTFDTSPAPAITGAEQGLAR